MPMAKKHTAHEFDTIIIGGGLSGLLFAAKFLNSSKKVALIDAGEDLGGHSKSFTTEFGDVDCELKFLPATSTSEAAVRWLEGCLEESIGAHLSELGPQSFDAGKLKPFLGFGDNAAMSCHEVNYYANPNFFTFEKTPKDWVQILKNKISDHKNIEIISKAKVTSLICQDHRVTGLIINAHQTLTADDFIWAAPVHTLASMLNEDNLPLRQKQKLAKTAFFASIHLDLIFSKKVSELNEMLILQGANEEPLVGRFSNLSDSKQLSQWICLIPNQEADNEEQVASILKYMKRQITRVYEGIMDFKIYERISLNNNTHGKLSLDRDDSKFGKLINLWVTQASLSRSGNLLGCLEESEKAWNNFAAAQTQSGADDLDHKQPNASDNIIESQISL